MHNAPPVIYPVGRFVWGRCFVAVLALVGAVGLLCWQVMSGAVGLTTLAAWALWILSTALAFWLESKESSVSGHLVWQGDAWYWQDGLLQEHTVQLNLLFDGGQIMLLSYWAAEGLGRERPWPQFAILRNTDMPLSWHGFRCAVYSRPLGDGRSSGVQELPMIL